MKTPLVLLLLFGIIDISGQTLSLSSRNNREIVFDIGARERIMYAKVIYEKGRKKKGRKILEEIISEELNNELTDTTLHGIYSTIAAINLVKIDSLAGFRSLLKVFNYFNESNCNDCKKNVGRIKTQIQEWSGIKHEYTYEIVYFLEESIVANVPEKLKRKNLISNQEIDTIRFVSFGMGGGFEIEMLKDRFVYATGRRIKNEVEIIRSPNMLSQIEWRKLLGILGQLELGEISKIKQPNGSRHFDGAYYSRVEIDIGTERYKSESFDDFRPAKELEPIVFYIRYLLRKKMKF